MRTFTPEQIKFELEQHLLWRQGRGGKRADFSSANLQGANLKGANLQDANLQDANLRDVNLQGANLQDANLQDANLRDVNLQGANLQDANLYRAYLQGANLYRAYLQDANLQDANLRDVNLIGANLYHAYLQDANLRDVNLQGANLQDANLTNTKLPSYKIAPETGSFHAYKKLANGSVVKLLVGKSAKRVNAIGSRKIRVEHAKVIAVVKGKLNEPCEGTHYQGVSYMVGKVVKPDMFDDDIRVECTNGIHCFLTQQEAEDWN